MRISSACIILFFLACALLIAIPVFQQGEFSLKHLTPQNYDYKEAQGCSNCKGEENIFMPRAAGVTLSGNTMPLDKRGWLASVHAVSQSHGDRVDTSCAWCHAPTADGATRNKDNAKPIPKGTWQGVSCFSCHPGALLRDKRQSLVINYTPGSDLSDSTNYIFRNRSDGKEMNAQCSFCHHECHDLLIPAKAELMALGDFRCIDCHMAAYAVTGGHVERFHNMKVEANLPFSCSGNTGRAMTCHDGRSKEWFKENIASIKGTRKKW